MPLCSPVLREVKSLPQVTDLCGSRPLGPDHQACTDSPGGGSRLQVSKGVGAPWPAWLTDADVLVLVVDQPLVDLVGDAHHVMLLAQAGHQLQFWLGEHLQAPAPNREACSERRMKGHCHRRD